MENVTDLDCRFPERVWEDFEIQNLGDFHNLYVKNDTLLLTDIFENFRRKCSKIYEIDLVHFLSVPGSAWETWLKNLHTSNIDL